MPLVEASLRKPGFREDIPITLGDGQSWFLPRPVVEFGLSFGDDGRPSFRRTSLGFGAAYMELLQSFHDSEGGDQYNRLAEMIVRLLRLNYKLEDADLVALLPFRPADLANVKMWEALTNIATGNPDPKGGPEDDT